MSGWWRMATHADRAVPRRGRGARRRPVARLRPRAGAVDLAAPRSSTTSPTPTISPDCRVGYDMIRHLLQHARRARRARARRVGHLPRRPRAEPAARAAVLRRHRLLTARGDPHVDLDNAVFMGVEQTISARSRPASWPTSSCSTPIRWRRSTTSVACPPCTAAAMPSTSAAHHAAPGATDDDPPAVGRAPPAAAATGSPIRFEQPSSARLQAENSRCDTGRARRAAGIARRCRTSVCASPSRRCPSTAGRCRASSGTRSRCAGSPTGT